MTNQTPANVFDATAANFEAEVLDRSLQVPVLIDFWAEWCNPCRLSAPAIEELAKTYAGKARVVKINTDYAGPVAQAFGVSGIPHFSIVKGSTVVDSLTGYSEELASILGGKLDTVLAG